MIPLRLLAVLGIALLSLQSSSSAAIINGLDPTRHDRFSSDGSINPTFLMDESQLSGVALQRAVLITPRHYVSAAHVHTPEVTFRGTDGIERTYQSTSAQDLTTSLPGQGPVGSDIRVYTLASDVDPSIVPVPIVVGDLNVLIGQTFFAMDNQMRAGRNVIDAIDIAEFDSGGGDTWTIRFSYDTDANGGTGGLGRDEIGLLGGDSGNAALIEIDGQLGLIGTHMGIEVPEGSSAPAGDRYDSFSTLVGAYEDQLADLVAADGQSFGTITVVAIPEPTSLAFLIGVFASGGLMRRRGRR
ncbi:hypothetical protein Mal15_68510 [Stieleria maiorica]|uniref:PEP-CTERM protein-sorting domain-containing protein n=1 Tax=Stieleria maiorica TaxID=2795974 RepID=A0A5B9MQL3_9BACT|nr:hypothetical protein [Stieleria maiorica]QEG02730.1 hypothetical protein Mal15_68510 [Stieleria maiorica]